MRASRILVVNADDFGQSPGINRGIIAAYERGILTSASMMVRWPAAAEAGLYARATPGLGVGLHFDLGEWMCRNGQWTLLYQVVPLDDSAAVANELQHQLDLFANIVGRNPTHIDSHQHVHREDGIREIVLRAAIRLGIPVREMCTNIRYFGGFYGQTGDGQPLADQISTAFLIDTISTLPDGITELGCHAGEGSDVESMYLAERALEVKALCDPAVRECVERAGVELRSFEGLPFAYRPDCIREAGDAVGRS